MNRRQKLVQERFLNNEEAIIEELTKVYGESLKDIEKKTKALQDDINRLDTLAKLSVDADEKEKLLSMQQSKVYQKQYQDALKKQVGSILDNMQVEEFRSVSAYLEKCYEDGFIGTMFDLQGQGIPLCFPLDQEAMVRAVQLDSKIKGSLYEHFGENVKELKKTITAEVSRGIATGMSYGQVAKQIKAKMVGNYDDHPGGALHRALTIARTEGHRIQVQSAMDACYKAKDKGADVVKQWDAALDSRTRESHQAVDGEIRELDKQFSNKLMFPGDPSGGAAEVVNCRCALLQRARWALDENELKTLQDRAEFFELDKADTFEEYKKKYLKAAEQVRQGEIKSQFTPAKTIKDASEYAKRFKVEADYSKYNLDVANSINETMLNIEDTFGSKALDQLHRIGTFPQGYSTRYKGVYVRSSDPALDGSLWLRNVGTKNALEKLGSVAKGAFGSGEWSTPEAMHTIRHELGHAIHRSIETPEINAQLTALRKSIVDERMKRHRQGDHNHKYSDWLSEYGMTNTKEFVAESVAEYLAGNPRETAAKVVEILIGGKQ